MTFKPGVGWEATAIGNQRSGDADHLFSYGASRNRHRGIGRVNAVIVVIKVAIVIIFIVAGIGFVSTANWITPANPTGAFIPPNTGEFGLFGWSGILRGAGVVFFAYIGFDAVSTAAQEARNPQRDMPKGIPRLARHLHDTLRPCRLRAHRHCAL